MTIEIIRGTDYDLLLRFTGVGDFTAATYDFLDVSNQLEGRLSAAFESYDGGEDISVVKVALEGTAPIPYGDHKFRLQVHTVGGRDISTRLIELKVV